MHTRDCGGKTRNLPAGWVAENIIASPLSKGDFWMLSHAGLLGSKIIITLFLLILNLATGIASRPSHYVLMHNDFTYMKQREAEELSYYLCYLHQGASCSVSIPTPIYCELILCNFRKCANHGSSLFQMLT